MSSPSLSIKGKASHTFDAIVIGSGISGGWAAKELTEKGLETLVLERGRNIEHGDYPTAMLEPWQRPYRGNITPEFRRANPILTQVGAVNGLNDGAKPTSKPTLATATASTGPSATKISLRGIATSKNLSVSPATATGCPKCRTASFCPPWNCPHWRNT